MDEKIEIPWADRVNSAEEVTDKIRGFNAELLYVDEAEWNAAEIEAISDENAFQKFSDDVDEIIDQPDIVETEFYGQALYTPEGELTEAEAETQFKLQVAELFETPELADIPDLHKIKDNYFQGKISREEFEKLFNSTFEAFMKEKAEKQREDHMLGAYLGLTLSEFNEVHAKNHLIHPGMDLKEHYIEIIRTDDGVEGHVHKRQCYPDGTPRLYFMDLNPLEKKQYTQFIDLMAYHDDGQLNIEMTAAMHEAFQERRFDRFIAKSGRRIPVMPKDPTGRNEPCPCGSGKKYKKCCLPKQGDLIRGMTVEDAQRIYGKDIFDISSEEAIPDSSEPGLEPGELTIE